MNVYEYLGADSNLTYEELEQERDRLAKELYHAQVALAVHKERESGTEAFTIDHPTAPGYWIKIHPDGWPHERIPVPAGWRLGWVPWKSDGPAPPMWLNPLPTIPREVYARTKERRHYSVEEQVAGAVEIGWVAAWHQALGYPTEDEE